MSRQLSGIKDRWLCRLTGSGIREIDSPIYVDGGASIEAMALEYQAEMLTTAPDGNGGDIWPNLNPKEDSNNIAHIFRRLKIMTQAYSAKICSKTYRDERMCEAAIDGLVRMQPYYKKNMQAHGNWWIFDIGGPQALNDALFLLSDRLMETEKGKRLLKHYTDATAYFVAIPEKARRAGDTGFHVMTGANLMDTALVCLIRGLLTMNLTEIERAAKAAKAVLPFVKKGDGFYEDGSFIQHSIIPYTGGYGPDLIRSFENIVYLLNGTDFMVADVKEFDHVRTWIKESYLPLFKNGEIMDMVRGRKSSRFNDNAHSAGRHVLSTLLLLAEYMPEQIRGEVRSEIKGNLERDTVDRDILYKDMLPNNAAIIRDLMDGDETASNQPVYYKTYGNMDRVVLHREKYSLGISMFSSRIGRFTYGNGENREGHHTCDGMLYLYTDDGFQFHDGYWPTVDHMRLPGITSDHLMPTVKAWFNNCNTKNWVGGSDVNGLYGSVGMDLEMKQPRYPKDGIVKAQPSDLTGKKSWFVFDDKIICLGAGINCTKSDYVETIVENRKIDGTNRLLSSDGEIKLFNGESVTASQLWMVLEGNKSVDGQTEPIGYYFPGKPKVSVLKEERTGAWSDINGDGNTEPITRTYVSIAFGHGDKPRDASYAYVLLPGKNESDMVLFEKEEAVEILSNTKEIQAVSDMESGLSGINFWSAGSVDGIQAETPCSVTRHDIQGVKCGNTFLGISDPTHKQDQITIMLDGQYDLAGIRHEDVTVQCVNGKTVIAVDTRKHDGASREVRLIRIDN